VIPEAASAIISTILIIKEALVLKLRHGIVELYRKVSTSLPPDMEAALKDALEKEEQGSRAQKTLEEILNTIKRARKDNRPVCLDSGIPVFYVSVPKGLSHGDIHDVVVEATRIATQKIPLSPNAVDIVTNGNSGDNTGLGFPIVYLEESPDSTLTVELMLKGSWSENESQVYKLPDESLGAGRNLNGVRACVLDAVRLAQGRGCPPYTVGVGVGATVDQVANLSRQQLRRKLGDRNPDATLAALEDQLLDDLNSLGIGVHGLGGKTTALGVKIGVNHRHPDSYFVDVALSCWSNRRGKLIW